MPADFSHGQRTGSEFLGSAFLLATVIGSGITGAKPSGGNEGLALLGNTLPTGAMLIPAALAALALLLISNYGCNRKTAEKVETPAPPPAATVPSENPPMAAAPISPARH